MKNRKILIFWPRYLSSQKEMFSAFLKIEGVKLIFICRWDINNPYNENPDGYLELNSTSAIQWNFSHIRFRKLSISDIYRMMKLIKFIIKNEKWDLVLTSTQYPVHSKFAFIFSKIYKKRIAIYTEAWIFDKQQNFLMTFYKKLNRQILLKADYVLVQGQNKLNVYRDYGVDNNKIKILPFIINDYMKDNYRIKEKKSTMKFLYLGRFIELKGIDILLEAFYEISLQNKNIELNLAGDNISSLFSISEKLRIIWEQICIKGIDKQIKILGYLNERDKKEILREVDIFIMPTKTNDGWGLSLMDATSAAIPCIATNVVGASFEFIKENTNGFIIGKDSVADLKEAMLKCINLTDKEFSEYSFNSRKIFSEYNNQEKVLQVMNELV